jgi:hypothetical protein
VKKQVEVGGADDEVAIGLLLADVRAVRVVVLGGLHT